VQRDVFADDTPQQTVHVMQDVVQIETLRLENLPAAECQQLPRQPFRALRGRSYFVDRRDRSMVGPEILGQKVAVAKESR
jgi:hypothetical protein